MEDSTPGFLTKTDARLEKRTAWIPCDRTAKFVLLTVHDGLGGFVRGEGAD